MLLGKQSDMEICGEAESAVVALQQMESLEPDLAVVDISLKQGNGIDLIKRMLQHNPSLPVLVASQHDPGIYAERAVQAGARGYLHKQEAATEIITAVRTVLSGRLYLNEDVAQQILQRVTRKGSRTEPTESERSPVEDFTDRELQVFELLGIGLSVNEIATRLKLSPKTVETYRERMKKKLSLDTAGKLSHYATRWVAEHNEH